MSQRPYFTAGVSLGAITRKQLGVNNSCAVLTVLINSLVLEIDHNSGLVSVFTLDFPLGPDTGDQ